MQQKRVCYAYKTRRGELKLIESLQTFGEWDLSLDDAFIGTYLDPWQAAEDASKSDFVNQRVVQLLKHVAIPSDLDRWQKSLRWI